jgi:hypothetical protein
MASLVLNGSTSGSITISSPAVSGVNVLSLPANTGTVLTNGTNTNFPAGSVLQVVSVNNKQGTTTTGNSYIASTLAASITPTSSANKILIFGHYYYRVSASTVSVTTTIYRNATDLTSGTIGLSYNYVDSAVVEMTAPFTILDSPATTSSTTYTLYFKRTDSAGTAYVGQANMDSVITLMEIKG